MTTFFKDEESNKVLHQYVHHLFGKSSGLLSYEYMIHFKPDLEYNGSVINYEIRAGKVIHIFIRSLPNEENWQRTTQILTRIFKSNTHNLREFLYRSTSLVIRKDAIKWYGVAVGGMDLDPVHDNERNEFTRKRVDVNSFEQKMIVSLHVKDKKSKKFVIVELIDGDVFSAQERALKILYGETLE